MNEQMKKDKSGKSVNQETTSSLCQQFGTNQDPFPVGKERDLNEKLLFCCCIILSCALHW